MKMRTLVTSFAVCCAAMILAAMTVSPQDPAEMEAAWTNTLRLDDTSLPPPASIDRVAWLAGTWRGTGLGGVVEEVWSEPSGGSMTFTFKLLQDGSPSMYEFGFIVEEGDSLVLKLKHFHASLAGWEEQEKFVSFQLVKLTDDAAYFDGLTYRREGDNRLRAFVAINNNGSVSEQGFVFARRGYGGKKAEVTQKENSMNQGKLKKLTPMLAVDRIEPSLEFWTKKLGFRNTGEVGEEGALDFVMLERDGIEIMYLTRASLQQDAANLNAAAAIGASLLYIEVDNIERVIANLDGVKIITPKHDEFYGMTEITILEPGGHLVTFASKTVSEPPK